MGYKAGMGFTVERVALDRIDQTDLSYRVTTRTGGDELAACVFILPGSIGCDQDAEHHRREKDQQNQYAQKALAGGCRVHPKHVEDVHQPGHDAS